MPIPDYQALMLPILRLLADGKERNTQEFVPFLAAEFNLTDAECEQLLEGGGQTVISNRAGWARMYLKRAALISSPRRSVYRITDLGLSTLASNPARIDSKYLEQFPAFVAFRQGSPAEPVESPAQTPTQSKATPEEALESAYKLLRVDLESELIQMVMSSSPLFFERLVVELLVRMGYGGSLQDAGQAVGKSGDGGIDGIIKEDRLGLDVIYIQAKRWAGTVGRPEIQKFAGALLGNRARKGVFITSSSFSSDAVNYAQGIDSKIVLIDGPALVKLMIEHNLGVSVSRTYEVKRIDSDYFLEE
ncbi:MAG TPA: restriction endonuclease [Planctomycetota bacterium]|nr:restriction endonuclease [Planctomycetota bacterium]